MIMGAAGVYYLEKTGRDKRRQELNTDELQALGSGVISDHVESSMGLSSFTVTWNVDKMSV